MMKKKLVPGPLTLKLHDGRAECMAPEGVTVTVIIK